MNPTNPAHIKFDNNTPQEGNFVGGTYSKEELEHPYTPIGITKGLLTIPEAQKNRKEGKYLLSRMLETVLGLPERAVIGYEDLDPVTGETTQDPKVLGYWDEKNENVITVEGRNLTAETYKILREQEEGNLELKHFLREKPSNIEGQGSIGTELES